MVVCNSFNFMGKYSLSFAQCLCIAAVGVASCACATGSGGIVTEAPAGSAEPSEPVPASTQTAGRGTVGDCQLSYGSPGTGRATDVDAVARACRASRGDALVCHPSNWITAAAAGCIAAQGHPIHEVSLRFEPAFDSVVWLVRTEGAEPGTEILALVRAVDGHPVARRSSDDDPAAKSAFGRVPN